MLNGEEKEPNIEQNNLFDITKKDDEEKPLIIQRIIILSLGLAGLFLMSFLLSAILAAFGIEDTTTRSSIATFASYVLVFTAMLFVLGKNITCIKGHFGTPKNYLIGLGFGILLIVFPIIYKYILSFFQPTTISDNESSLRATITVFPILSTIVFGIIGPLVEESTYRFSLFSLFKNKWVAYMVSVFVFALLHFNFLSDNIVNELLNLPTYLFAGLILAICYHCFGLAGSMTAHITNNLFSIIVYIITINMVS